MPFPGRSRVHPVPRDPPEPKRPRGGHGRAISGRAPGPRGGARPGVCRGAMGAGWTAPGGALGAPRPPAARPSLYRTPGPPSSPAGRGSARSAPSVREAASGPVRLRPRPSVRDLAHVGFCPPPPPSVSGPTVGPGPKGAGRHASGPGRARWAHQPPRCAEATRVRHGRCRRRGPRGIGASACPVRETCAGWRGHAGGSIERAAAVIRRGGTPASTRRPRRRRCRHARAGPPRWPRPPRRAIRTTPPAWSPNRPRPACRPRCRRIP